MFISLVGFYVRREETFEVGVRPAILSQVLDGQGYWDGKGRSVGILLFLFVYEGQFIGVER